MSLILDGTNGLSDVDGSAATPAIRGTDANTGIFFPAADTIAFSEGGVESMRINSSGNVGIGTTSPTDTSSYGRALDIQSSTGAAIYLRDSDGPTTDYGVVAYDSPIDSLTLGSLTASTGIVRFIAAGNEAARIDSSGNLLVGATSTNRKLAVYFGSENFSAEIRNTASPNPYGMYIYYSAATPNNATSQFLACVDSSAVTRAEIRSNGGLANYSANNVNLSDRREKTNFAPATSYLNKICAIPVQTFNYIDQNMEVDGGLTLGVVAQDVQTVAPELVMESNWGTKDKPKMRLSIYQTDLQYALMKALQELKAEFDAYKASHP